ncbi:hypothetical protein BN14_10382 [Rhizoctonia solani AG-1 IB]|uniref:Uncharacterized protein n=1 Tax=Thanatephorus cucumeris (strain AG1-IB / isolate 7/3/14) TaxID=1108050 RepID=M5CA05_THACB|nr:hypothetical protein BN14_10382 [Rhizoctonia solani AG-1 IB]
MEIVELSVPGLEVCVCDFTGGVCNEFACINVVPVVGAFGLNDGRVCFDIAYFRPVALVAYEDRAKRFMEKHIGASLGEFFYRHQVCIQFGVT